ncbi:hypothetical protein SD961_12750 [Erwinia sp. MMLR14_017]|uniref:hypothetical protein n=1 Tax=Erwinia sp. MMLR14_017 TaxID=3093842 RepID=UPI00298FD774|nr:hypothetical protein [Erwinia sp. MMLR14_017]MDW8846749.1 hypothetical protein [Erwinia sp. MMLR14_017]
MRQKWRRAAENSLAPEMAARGKNLLAPEMAARGRNFINRLGRISSQQTVIGRQSVARSTRD